ncbi:MAG: SPFH domain-containing protein [Planctomycetota bacterium]
MPDEPLDSLQDDERPPRPSVERPRPVSPRRPQVRDVDGPRRPPFRSFWGRLPSWSGLLALALLIVLAGFGYWWFVQRVDIKSNECLILIRKVGETLPARTGSGARADDQVVLFPALLQELGESPASTRYKGVRFDPILEGRHFYGPFLWERITAPAVNIGGDEVGILIRKFGKPLPAGKTVATESDERGPELNVLKRGSRNYINPLAYEVRRVRPVIVPPGHVGIQTLLTGRDPENPNVYVVKPGERGVQPEVLPPGTYDNNPYACRIDLLEVRSHTLDLHGEDGIRFPSNDSFDIVIDATVEYAIRQDMAPYVLVALGDHADIRDKLILPEARSLCRIEGSKLAARDFISGEMRIAFQNQVFTQLRDSCYDQGIEIRAALIRQIVPPPEIAGPISDRQLAEQEIMQYRNEIKVAEAEAKLVEQQEMQKQNQALGEASREIVAVVKEAEQQKAVALTEAQQRLEVARLQLEAAREKAAAVLARGRAEAEVMLLKYEAEAKPLGDAVAAFGGGETYAQYFFYQKLGPALKSVLASTDGPFADVFRALGTAGPHTERKRPATPGTTTAPAAAAAGGGQ